MSLAGDEVISANGWSSLEQADNKKPNQEHLNFTHKVAGLFSSTEGQQVLKAMVDKYLITSFTNDNEPNSLIRKQGRADVVKYILSQIEISNNTK